jgi:DNA-binding LacI/PurR family transcriptional regulator
LAKEIGIGMNNTHRAVQQLVAEGVLVSRPKLGTFVADPSRGRAPQPSLRGVSAPGLGSQPTGLLVGKIVRSHFVGPSTDAFVMRMVAAFESHLAERGCTLLRQSFGDANPDLRGANGVHGLAIFNPNSFPAIQCDPQLVVIAVNTAAVTPLERAGRFDVVTVEQEQSAYLAGRRLREAGCNSVCVLGCRDPQDHTRFNVTSEIRLRGFERGWGTEVPRDRLLLTHAYTIFGGVHAAERYLGIHSRPDGVFATSDELAVGFIAGTTTHGLQPGRDYDIIGFDRQQIGRGLPNGDLTTIEVPVEQMGIQAAEFLAERLLDPDRPVRKLALGCKLFEGVTIRSRS